MSWAPLRSLIMFDLCAQSSQSRLFSSLDWSARSCPLGARHSVAHAWANLGGPEHGPPFRHSRRVSSQNLNVLCPHVLDGASCPHPRSMKHFTALFGTLCSLTAAAAAAASSTNASSHTSSSTFAKHFTPERLILAPRSSSDFQLSPNGSHFARAVSYAALDGSATSSSVYVYRTPSKAEHAQQVQAKDVNALQGISFATWLDDEHVVFVNNSAIYSAHIDAPADSTKLLDLAAPIAEDSLHVVSQGNKLRIVFAAEVYEDGKLETVSKIETKEHEEEWSRVKAYDGDNGAFFRHWDTWNRPTKRSQLFDVTLTRKTDPKGWSTGSIRNLLHGTDFESPIPPFGGSDHWDANSEGVVFASKTPGVPQAWHTISDIYHADFQEGKITKLTPEKHGAVSSPRFSPDGKNVAFLEMGQDGYESDKAVVQIYNLRERKQRALLTRWDRSPASLEFSKAGDKLFLLADDRQRERLFEFDLTNAGQIETPKEVGLGDKVGSIAKIVALDDDVSLLSASSLRSVQEVYLHIHSSNASYPLTWVTGSPKSTLRDVQWAPLPPQDFQYPSPDYVGEKRWGTIHYPPGYQIGADESSAKGKWPLIVLIHGGPEGSWGNSWSTRWNPEVFAGAGYIAVTLNPAGSTGFGQKLTKAVLNDWGGQPFRDIIAGTHHILDTHPEIDRSRVGAAGASFGGFSVNWINGHNDDSLFKALVCHDGVWNLLNTWYGTDELYFPEREFGEALPWDLKARQIYLDNSPEAHAAKAVTPQLTIHGGKDFRLDPIEGISAFNALRRKGVPSRLLYFEDEGHWVLNPRNSLRWHNEVLGWFDRFISKGPK